MSVKNEFRFFSYIFFELSYFLITCIEINVRIPIATNLVDLMSVSSVTKEGFTNGILFHLIATCFLILLAIITL